MGSGNNFFAKLAQHDPLAQALHLPGYNAAAGAQATRAAGNSPFAAGPYTGVAPSLAGANAGYAAGGPGSNPGVTTMPGANPYVAAARTAAMQQRQPVVPGQTQQPQVANGWS
jgi:hypothetical protein